MGHIAGIALTTAAMFLVVVAVMLNNPALFYMSTAMIATLGASRIQAWLSVRGLRFERTAPEVASVGDLVTIEITAWSERRIRRPLVTVMDNLPARIAAIDLSPSMPIAPAFDIPVRTQYRFRPLRRGVFRWHGLRVAGTDALGLVTLERNYPTPPVEMTVLPVPIPVSIELPAAAAWGLAASEGNRGKGHGMEPRGTREYVPGDPLRHVHWRSSARTGTLLVKEFESGIQAAYTVLLQRTRGSEIGRGAHTTLELMCGHCAYLAEQLVRSGATVDLPGLETPNPASNEGSRTGEILRALAQAEADQDRSLGAELLARLPAMTPGSTVLLMLAVEEPDLPDAIRTATSTGAQVVALVYDADLFRKGRGSGGNASAKRCVRTLQQAGAVIVVMPVEGLRS